MTKKNYPTKHKEKTTKSLNLMTLTYTCVNWDGIENHLFNFILLKTQTHFFVLVKYKTNEQTYVDRRTIFFVELGS